MIIEVERFEASCSGIVADLARRAFATAGRDAQPDQSDAFIAHILGPLNPAGCSRLAIARDGGTAIGCLAATPARFQTDEGRLVTGHQIGYFFVDRCAQGWGVGTTLLAELGGALGGDPDAFVYTYPNPRSIGLFDRSGYQRLATIPTCVFPVWPRRRKRRSGPFEIPSYGDSWVVEELDADSAEASARQSFGEGAHETGWVRDNRFFAWRYCAPPAHGRYRFLSCRARETDELLLVVLAHHRFSGASFTIVVDLLARDPTGSVSTAVKAARRTGGTPFVYANTNFDRLGKGETAPLPLRLAVPGFANPRPVELLWIADSRAITRQDLLKSLVMTGDWLGF